MNMNATSTRILSAMRNLAVACAAFVTVTLAGAQDYVPDWDLRFWRMRWPPSG